MIDLSNKRNRERLIEYLLNFAFENGIGFIMVKVGLDDPSASYPDTRMMVINTNLSDPNELPFIIAHEIAHLMLKHSRLDFDSSPINGLRTDSNADKYALKMFLEYCKINDFYFDTWFKFAEVFCIPKRCYYLLNDLKNVG